MTKGVLPGGDEITVFRTFDDHLRVESETVSGSTVSFGYREITVKRSAFRANGP